MRVNARVPQEYNRINLEPISGALGAIVHGVDMRELDDEIITELHQAWMDHKVLFFRNQELTSAQHVEYGKAFGELEIHPFTSNLEEQPEIIVLESTPENFVAAESWHSDVTFRECPPKGSVLVGRVLPPYGGDTAWADMQLAYERLSDDLKEQIEGLARSIHTRRYSVLTAPAIDMQLMRSWKKRKSSTRHSGTRSFERTRNWD